MDDGDREIIEHFKWMRGNTIELAQRMTNELMGRTPDGESQKLSVLLTHAGCSGAWWMSNVLRDGGRESERFSDDREEMIEEMQWWRDRVVSFFEANGGERMGQTFFFTEEDGTKLEWTGRNRLFYFIAHEADHYGRIVLALRQWGFDDIPWSGCG